ncbi:hypothetical protein HYH02_013385 [Chlamydomonas schloesseri]|uniref:Fido domain-containing protein n=1 Tax=Chlamydomonas schloesseri TaxID=2026947 RepID=A0A835SSW0_9CHLO|nr:hypothetical protein HYH02_013385 [Chlamydomonas schloesseri]|eukprot:KAG2431251.1 hypothetical protein HYH02_013385 [Chlamydomonas schloesseri]
MAIPELTSAELKATHRIMMWGAAGATPGEYRTTTISAPSHVVAPPAAADVPAGSGSSPTGIAAGVEAALGRFNRSLALLVSAGRQLADVNLLAASLAAEVYALRPFPHGNGRLCRLLAAYALMAAGDEAGGDPFPEAMRHYNDGSGDGHGNGGMVVPLAAHILECRHFAWRNYVRNLRYQQ